MAIKNPLIIITLIFILAIIITSINPIQQHNITQVGNSIIFGNNQLTGKILKNGASSAINQNIQISQINYLDTKKTMSLNAEVTYSNSNFELDMQCCIDGNCKSRSTTNIVENTLLCNQNGNFPAYITVYVTSEGLLMVYERTLKIKDFYNNAGGTIYQPWQ